MAYIKLTNGNPEHYSIGKLRRDNPNTSFPKHVPEHVLAEYDVYPVVETPQPAFDPVTQTVSQDDTPKYVSGQWVRKWTVRDKTAEELAEKLTRWRQGATLSRRQFCIAAYRAGLLSEADAVMAAKGEWPASFDAALVGLPANVVTEAKIEWAAVSEIRRSAPLLETVRQSAGVTEGVLDTMFGYQA